MFERIVSGTRASAAGLALGAVLVAGAAMLPLGTLWLSLRDTAEAFGPVLAKQDAPRGQPERARCELVLVCRAPAGRIN